MNADNCISLGEGEAADQTYITRARGVVLALQCAVWCVARRVKAIVSLMH